MPTDDETQPRLTRPPLGANDPEPATSRTESTPPTFPSEAESLLKHLRLGGSNRSAPPEGAAGAFPQILNYEIERELGRGGMGVVYKARHTALHHTVAIKMILASAHAAPGEVARFLQEAEAIAAVKHPNVVRVYDLGNSDSRPYFVMEFVEGGNLATRLKNHGTLSPTAAAELIEAVARGVQAAHDAGIVHRDLKPANILLVVGSGQQAVGSENKKPDSALPTAHFPLPTLEPKVSDFGLAKRLSSDLTRSQAVMGTPQYMAPEQAGGKAKFVGPQADVYALGVILYECLCGTVPFTGDDAWSLIRQVLEDPPKPLRKRVPGVPRDLELICLKCLEKEPHHRYPTAAALSDDLLKFLRGEPVSVRPLSAATRVMRWAKKRPAAATLAALSILAALVIPALTVGIAGWLDRRAAVAAEARQKEAEARRAEAEAKRAEEQAKRAEGEAKRAEEEAQRARVESDKSRLAAERLADARELFALQNKFRNRSATRPLGWTAATRSEVPRALALAAGDSDEVEDIRSAAASALLSHDLFPLESIERGLSAAATATDPKTGLVAVGEFKSWGGCRILLIDLATGLTVRQLTFMTVPVSGGGPLEVGQDGTRSMAFSPDGKRLFVGTRSSRVVRFDLESPQNTPAKIWNASQRALEELAVSPDGKSVYGLCRPEAPVFAWDAETGQALTGFYPDEPATAFRTFAVLPSGDVIASNGTNLYHWKADFTLVSRRPNPGCVRLAHVSGSMLLMSDGFNLDIYDLGAVTLTNQLTDPNLRRVAHEGYVRTLAVHPSGAFVATQAGENDRAVKVWELASGRHVGTVTIPGTGPLTVAWSGDGNYLLASATGYLTRWRFAPAESQQFACFAGPPLDSAVFTSGGKVAALGTYWHGKRELLIGKAAGASEAISLEDRGNTHVPDVAADPDGMLAITMNRPGILTWKPGTRLPTPTFAKEVCGSPRFSPDGKTLWAVVGSKTVRTYDRSTAQELGRWNNSIADIVTGLSGVNALAVGRSGAIAGGRDGTAYLLDSACQSAGAFRGAGDPVLSVAITPNDAFAFAGTQNGKLRTIRLADKTELAAVTPHPGGLTAIAVNRDSTMLATGGRDRSVRLWKWSGKEFEPVLTVADLTATVIDLQFDATGRLLVLLANEHAVRVWNLDKLKSQLAAQNLGW